MVCPCWVRYKQGRRRSHSAGIVSIVWVGGGFEFWILNSKFKMTDCWGGGFDYGTISLQLPCSSVLSTTCTAYFIYFFWRNRNSFGGSAVWHVSMLCTYYYVRRDTQIQKEQNDARWGCGVIYRTSTCPPSFQVALVVPFWMSLLPTVHLSASLFAQCTHASNPFVTTLPPFPPSEKSCQKRNNRLCESCEGYS